MTIFMWVLGIVAVLPFYFGVLISGAIWLIDRSFETSGFVRIMYGSFYMTWMFLFILILPTVFIILAIGGVS